MCLCVCVSQHTGMITVDEDGLRVASAVSLEKLPDVSGGAHRTQLRSFANAWTALRPVERKRLAGRKLDLPVTVVSLRRMLATIPDEPSFLRSIPRPESAPEICTWCKGEAAKDARYCSRECYEEAQLRIGANSTKIRVQVFALERGICALCGFDAHTFAVRFKALPPADRIQALLTSGLGLPKKLEAKVPLRISRGAD